MTTYITNLGTVKDALQIPDTDTSQDDLITRLLGSVTKYIEGSTRRELTTGVSTRLFDGNGKGYLMVDDFISVSSVKLLGFNNEVYKTFSISSELQLYPLNTTPKNRIQINNFVTENPYRYLGGSPYVFSKGYGNVEVVANWGSFSAIPADLVDLGVDLIVAKVNKGKTKGLRSVSIGGESMTFSDSDLDETMKETLASYKKDFVDVW
jgi:hypothetical protein